MKSTVIHEAPELPNCPRIERIDNPPARPSFHVTWGSESKDYGRDWGAAFASHGRNIGLAAEQAGLLETPAPESRKTYDLMENVGRARYVVNFHDGQKTHADGSPFFDTRTFTSKRAMHRFVSELETAGYRTAH